jgi:hypothetical protein
MENMINTVFYTFSTISQTLAGAIALLGAFVLYRLQSLSSEIEKDARNLAQQYITGRFLLSLLARFDGIVPILAIKLRWREIQALHVLMTDLHTDGIGVLIHLGLNGETRVGRGIAN